MYANSTSTSTSVLSPSTTIDSLISSTQYTDTIRVRNDISALLQQLQSLQLSIQQLTHNSGYTDTLCSLHGTVPIWYRSTQYNIPIQLYVPLVYPQRPPIVYVKPTNDMRIKDKHKHVDMNGLVYLPYLNQWNQKQSNLIELITVMSSIFSDDPPVYKQVINIASITDRLDPPPYKPPNSINNNNNRSPSSTLSPQLNSTTHSLSPNKSINSMDVRAQQKDQLVQQLTTRLKKWLENFHSTSTHEIEQLIEYKAQLHQHTNQLLSSVDSMKYDINQLSELNNTIQQYNNTLQSNIQKLQSQPHLDIDHSVYGSDTLSQQLCDSIAQFNAIDDTIYLLDRLLNDNKIDIITHLKLIRQLARKQYFINELINTIMDTIKQMNQTKYQYNSDINGNDIKNNTTYQYHYPHISLK